MAGGFSAGGLITGIDSNALIRQLILFERRPIVRFESRISVLEKQKTALSDLRSQLLGLRNLIKDFQIGTSFGQFTATSSDESVLTAVPGANPTAGSFSFDVLQLASATTAVSSGKISSGLNTAVPLASSGIATAITSGSFTINGVQHLLDPNVKSLDVILAEISGGDVTATYDPVTDTVTIENDTPGDTSIINFGAAGDTSNFLSAIHVAGATQTTGGAGATVVTSTRGLATVNTAGVLNTVSLAGGAVTAGSFSINGITITVDPTTDALSDVLSRINSSDAKVTASYDPITDSIRVVSDELGSRTINFTSGTSNFLDIMNLTGAIQLTGSNAQFTVDGGPVQTRNTNEITDAVNGVTLKLLGLGMSTVTASEDDDSGVEDVRAFVEKFNETITKIAELTGDEGVFKNDSTIRGIQTFLRTNLFAQVTGITGDFATLLSIGISSGSAFSPSAPFQLELDEDELRAALISDRDNVAALFTNDGDTGIMDVLFTFVDEISGLSGFLNARSRSSGSIDDQIRTLNDRIDAAERRVESKEIRLRLQFARLEQLVSTFQSQGAALGGIGNGFGGLF